MSPASIMTAERAAMDLKGLLAGYADVASEYNRQVTGLTLDSRKLTPGDVFFALGGTREHGSQYVDAACRAGAAAVLVDDERKRVIVRDGTPVLNVANLKRSAGRIASRFFGEPSQALKVIGVTGTNGKSTVTHLIAQALEKSERFKPCGIIGTLGNGFLGSLSASSVTTPDAIGLQQLLASLRDQKAQAVSMEVSSHALDQWRVEGVHFAAAVFTNLTRDHLDYHGSMDRYLAAKRRLFEMSDLGAAVVNLDDDYGRQLLAALPRERRVIGYTMLEYKSSTANEMVLRGHDLKISPRGLNLRITLGNESVDVTTRLLGRFNAQNLLAAIGALVAVGFSLREAGLAMHDANGVLGRMDAVAEDGQPLVIIDYAHTPDGLRQLLTSSRELCGNKLWCVFGCGGNRDVGKRPLMGAIAAELADEIVVTSDNPRDEDPARIIAAIVEGMPTPVQSQVIVESDRRIAIQMAIGRAASDDVVVVAGKGHEDYQEVRGVRQPLSDHVLVTEALRERRQ
ncbi:MAG: UDP-N-acetylmuramoyl-L-alanyl-D-glutamate--2,6-diaminopimelate ligase [Gammaproteobacteria bacterium]